MKLRIEASLPGAGVGAAVGAALLLAAPTWWLALLTFVLVAGVGYVAASLGSRSATSTTGFGELMRGGLVGLNAAANGVLAAWILAGVAVPLGVAVGLVLATLNLACAVPMISQNAVFRGVLGYSNWSLPMSWPIVGLGVAFWLTTLLLHALSLGRRPFLKVEGFRVDAKTGTFFVKGGLVGNLNPIDTAFNMGNFSFVDRAFGTWAIDHEAGHTLNLAAFGWIFHLIGALDENVIRGKQGYDALSERLAESHVPHSTHPRIPMWA